jgi:hypothetical protein
VRRPLPPTGEEPVDGTEIAEATHQSAHQVDADEDEHQKNEKDDE